MDLQNFWPREMESFSGYTGPKIQIDEQWVYISEGVHFDEHGMSISHEDFLTGKYDALVKSKFDENTASEVKMMIKKAKEYPPFIKKREQQQKREKFVESLQEHTEYKHLDRDPNTQNGHLKYELMATSVTIKGQKIDLEIEKNVLRLKDTSGDLVEELKLHGHVSSGVYHEGHFYLLHANHLAVISEKGEVVFDTWESESEKSLFGTALRLDNLYRHGDLIFIRYYWLKGNRPSGFLIYEFPEGFVGRWN